MKNLFLVGLGIAAALGFWAYKNNSVSVSSYEEAFLDACDHAIKGRLLSPAGYDRVEAIGFRQRPATLDEYLGWTNSWIRSLDRAENKADPNSLKRHNNRVEQFSKTNHTISEAFIKYNSPNAFGTLIRGGGNCTLVDASPTSIDDLERLLVRINGLTDLQWTLKQITG